MKFYKQSGIVLLEGLIVMGLITVIIFLTFQYIRLVNKEHITKVHQQRANLFMIESFEAIYSARDSFVNRNKKSGWENFIASVNNTEDQQYVLSKSDIENDVLINGQWFIERKQSPDIFSFNIAPFADYQRCIWAHFEDDAKEKISFDVEIRWNTAPCGTADYFYNIRQSLTLTHHDIYENLY